MARHIVTHSDAEFVQTAVSLMKGVIDASIEKDDCAILGLSGGSTPKPVYEALGKENIDWTKVKLFLVDERLVEPTDDRSNQKLVRETILKNALIPEVNIVFPDTRFPIDDCILKYSLTLKELWDKKLPDLLVLGMGDDGHIASLFPPLSDIALGDKQLVLHTTTDHYPVTDRISLSLNALAAPVRELFLLKGKEKKKVWEQMLSSTEDDTRWPAKRVLKGKGATVISQW